VLSYVYSTKVSKAFDYDQKKEHIIGLIQNNFPSSLPASKSNQYDDKTYPKDLSALEKRKYEDLEQRMNKKKYLEMETKKF